MYGIDGNAGKIADMSKADIWDPCAVKLQSFKTAIESSCMILRIDDIVSGIQKQDRHAGGRKAEDSDEMPEDDGAGYLD